MKKIVFALCLLAVAGCDKIAPEGYQDEKGFHYGRQPDNDNKYRLMIAGMIGIVLLGAGIGLITKINRK